MDGEFSHHHSSFPFFLLPFLPTKNAGEILGGNFIFLIPFHLVLQQQSPGGTFLLVRNFGLVAGSTRPKGIALPFSLLILASTYVRSREKHFAPCPSDVFFCPPGARTKIYVHINKFDLFDSIHNNHLSSPIVKKEFFFSAKTSGMSSFAFIPLFGNLFQESL